MNINIIKCINFFLINFNLQKDYYQFTLLVNYYLIRTKQFLHFIAIMVFAVVI